MYKKLFLAGLLATVLFPSCTRKKVSESVPVIPVKCLSVVQKAECEKYDYVGVIEEELSSNLSFSVAGTIEMTYVDEGQYVEKGQLLAILDTTNLNSSYNAARAQLLQAEDAMRRIQQLYDNQSVPETKYIDIRTQLEKARSLEAIAGKNLSNSRLTAPFKGIIGKKSVENGENVMLNQSVYTLFKIENVKVKISIPEREIAKVLKNQQALIYVPALEGSTYKGKVEERGIVADPISHSYTVRIKVVNTSTKLLPGMVCRVSIMGNDQQKAMLAIPSQCIQSSDNRQFVWRMENGKAKRSYIETGRFTSDGVEVISGLKEGEEIIVEGYQGLYDGVKIKVQ